MAQLVGYIGFLTLLQVVDEKQLGYFDFDKADAQEKKLLNGSHIDYNPQLTVLLH